MGTPTMYISLSVSPTLQYTNELYNLLHRLTEIDHNYIILPVYCSYFNQWEEKKIIPN
jgi:hypothetical protein